MDFNILLIIIQFVQIVISFHPNSSNSETCEHCSPSFFRRKRANIEYRRWQNLETTEEFIVKVLDDEILTPRAQQQPILAINIQPVTKLQEKIIISGAKVPSHTAVRVTDKIKDYTRFDPLNPFTVHRQGETKFPKVKYVSIQYSERDESPPASPQFVPRSNVISPQQFAPIAPVSFTRKPTLTPLVPKKENFDLFDKKKTLPSRTLPARTSPNEDLILPMRTDKTKDIFLFENFQSPDAISRTSYYDQHRKSSTESKINQKYNENEISQESDTESYVNPFYSDEDSETIKTSSNRPTDTLDDKSNFDNDKDLEESSGDQSDEFEYKELDIDIPEATKSKTTKGANNKITSRIGLKDLGKETLKFINKSVNNDMKRRQHSVCSILRKRDVDLNTQRTLHEIVKQLKHWADKSPISKWVDITRGNYTAMENPIYMMIIDDPSRGQIVSAKQTVMIVAGIQGKDHHAVTAAMFLLYQLIERSESHSDLLTKHRFWIIPVFNPDGYEYAMTFPKRRGWLKNLRQIWTPCKDDSCKACEEYGIGCTIQPCFGVNLDRNFEYQWIPTKTLRADHPCGDLYAGPRQLSEVETFSLTHYLHEQKTPIHTFIALKEGDVLGVMYPYSHTKKKRAMDITYRRKASVAANAAYTISGRPYVAGQTSEFLPLYAGGIDDWVDGHLGIDNTFNIMIFRPTDAKNSKLIMERVVHEAYAATHTLLLPIEPVPPPLIGLTKSEALPILPTKSFITVTIFVTIICCG